MQSHTDCRKPSTAVCPSGKDASAQLKRKLLATNGLRQLHRNNFLAHSRCAEGHELGLRDKDAFVKPLLELRGVKH